MSSDEFPSLDSIPRGEFAFPGPLRDVLVASIASGAKTSTSYLLAEYEPDEDPADSLGSLEAVLDSHERIVCVTRTTCVEIVRLGDVTDAHAIAEGEGYTDAAEWRAGHERFWHSPEYVAEMGWMELDDDTPVVCSAFEIDRRYPVTEPRPWDAD